MKHAIFESTWAGASSPVGPRIQKGIEVEKPLRDTECQGVPSLPNLAALLVRTIRTNLDPITYHSRKVLASRKHRRTVVAASKRQQKRINHVLVCKIATPEGIKKRYSSTRVVVFFSILFCDSQAQTNTTQ